MKYIEIEIDTVDVEINEMIGENAVKEAVMCMVKIEYIESFLESDSKIHINMVSGERFVAKNIDYKKLKEAIYG